MKFRNISIMKIFAGLLALVLISGIQITSIAQITTYQYRHVPDEKIDEFIKRETTYWSKVAQKAVDNKKMSFWALLEKIGGYDLLNSSNFLFINTFPDIYAVYRGEVFNASAIFPDIQMN